MGQGLLLLLAYYVISGFTPIFGRLAVAEIPVMLLAAVRFGVAGALLAGAARAMGRRLPLTRATVWPLLGLAALCVPINQYGFLTGLKLANASHAAIFYALNPVLVFWISLVLRQGTFRGVLCVASILAFAGAAAVACSSGSVGSAGDTMLRGDALLLLAIVSWSLFSVLSKPVIARHGAISTLAAVFLLGTLLHLPLALSSLTTLDLERITWRGAGGAAYLTLITSFVNYLLWYVAIARYDLSRIAVLVNANFLITIGAGNLWLGEPLSGMFLLGAGLTLASIVLVAVDRGRDRGKGAATTTTR